MGKSSLEKAHQTMRSLHGVLDVAFFPAKDAFIGKFAELFAEIYPKNGRKDAGMFNFHKTVWSMYTALNGTVDKYSRFCYVWKGFSQLVILTIGLILVLFLNI